MLLCVPDKWEPMQSSLMCVVHAMVQWLFIMMLRYLMVD
jgi:hypothetical protein